MDIFCETKDEAEVESRPPGPDPRLKLWIGGLEPTLSRPVGHNLPEPTCPSFVTHNYKSSQRLRKISTSCEILNINYVYINQYK